MHKLPRQSICRFTRSALFPSISRPSDGVATERTTKQRTPLAIAATSMSTNTVFHANRRLFEAGRLDMLRSEACDLDQAQDPGVSTHVPDKGNPDANSHRLLARTYAAPQQAGDTDQRDHHAATDGA